MKQYRLVNVQSNYAIKDLGIVIVVIVAKGHN